VRHMCGEAEFGRSCTRAKSGLEAARVRKGRDSNEAVQGWGGATQG
jgi:hypothetical protein